MKKLALACAVTTGLVVTCGCSGPPPVVDHMAAVDDVTDLDDRHEDIPILDATEWVELYRPELSSPGYNLVLYQRRVPMLIDMQGRIVHSWPGVRAVGRVRLDGEGRLSVIGIDDVIKEYDWEGHLTWAYRLPSADDMPHHDLIKLANGNHLVLALGTGSRTDFIQEIDRDGRVVWSWEVAEHLDRDFPDRDRSLPDPTHINSVFELPENRWFDAGDERFRPGNILVSARNVNTIFIIDKASGDIVWTYRDRLDYQHEAQMVPKGLPGAGLVVFFNNGKKNRHAYRKSEVRAIDPVRGRTLWSFAERTFFSSVAGSQQVLPNGNVLVTSSQGGRVFEITPDKRKVWEWIPPYLPMRVLRYPPDHCPQLEAMGELDPTAVERTDRPPWVDIELGKFAVAEEYRVVSLYDKRRRLLTIHRGCRQVLLPAAPVVYFGYGFDDSKLDGAPGSARFVLTVRPSNGRPDRRVIDDVVASDAARPFEETYRAVPGLGLQRAELCVDVMADDPAGSQLAHPSIVLENPTFYSQKRNRMVREWKRERKNRLEESLEERQLRAIGYIQ